MPNSSHTALILGASRGLGLGLAREFLSRDWQVIGTVRQEKTKLHDLAALSAGHLSVEHADINDPAQLTALRDRLAGRALDVLFVNAGVANDPNERVGAVSTETFTHIMLTNALGPMRAIETLAPLVKPGGVIAAMSSGLASIEDNRSGGWEVYRASKAALNMLMRSYASRETHRSLAVIAPGWVRTDMGGPHAPLSIEQSMPGVVDQVLAGAGKAGLRFVDYRGEALPW